MMKKKKKKKRAIPTNTVRPCREGQIRQIYAKARRVRLVMVYRHCYPPPPGNASNVNPSPSALLRLVPVLEASVNYLVTGVRT